MRMSIASLLTFTALSAVAVAHAQAPDAAPAPGTPGTTTTTTTVTTEQRILVPAPTLNRADAKDLKNQSEAQYKARKKIADANLDLNKADCESTSDGAVARACKSDAKAQAAKDKAEAKVIHAQEKSDIDAVTH